MLNKNFWIFQKFRITSIQIKINKITPIEKTNWNLSAEYCIIKILNNFSFHWTKINAQVGISEPDWALDDWVFRECMVPTVPQNAGFENIYVGDECWWRNTLETSLKCWLPIWDDFDKFLALETSPTYWFGHQHLTA